MIQKAKKNQRMTAGQVSALERSIDHLREEKKVIIDSPAYGIKARLMRGAKIVAEKSKCYLTDGSKLPRGEAEHLFTKAISVYGALYRVEHGGLQLSNSDCIDSLEKIKEITAFTSAAYKIPAVTPAESTHDEEAREEKNLCVGRVMTQLTFLAGPLYTLACLMKSQKKLGASEIASMTLALCTLWIAWILNFPDQHFFPKLHHLLAHMLFFAVMFEMIGIVDEEGKESCHPQINTQANILKSMGSSKARMETFTRRIQAHLDPETEAANARFRREKRSKANRPKKYRKKDRTTRLSDSHDVEVDDLDDGPPGYKIVNYETLIKYEWAEAYDLCVRGKVPSSWCGVIDSNNNISSIAKAKARCV